jgi:hypothetical protein
LSIGYLTDARILSCGPTRSRWNVRQLPFTNDRVSFDQVLVNVAGNELEIVDRSTDIHPTRRVEMTSARLTIPASSRSSIPHRRRFGDYNNFRPQNRQVWVRYDPPRANRRS